MQPHRLVFVVSKIVTDKTKNRLDKDKNKFL